MKLLMIEDSESLAAIYRSYLSDRNWEIRTVATVATARDEWRRFQPDIVILDVDLPDGNGLELLEERPPETDKADVIVMTAYGSSDMALRAVKLGAADYLSKPFDADRLHVTLDNVTEKHQLKCEVSMFAKLRQQEFCDFIGTSIPMQSVYRTIESVAASDATAFITGESGTGKEVTASAIHQLSRRSRKTLHAINCGAIPSELMESELFGHVKGAFTGATSTRDGAVTVADGGTLFLDEVCEMELDLQKKMLRFLQTGEFQRVGSNKVERVDVRFVCATNRDPFEEVRKGNFREDLYYRLHVVPIALPPLRERGEDILSIASHFLQKFTQSEGKRFRGFDNDAKQALLSYAWPGNVRQLQNVLHNAVVLHEGNVVTRNMLPIESSVAAKQSVIPFHSRKSLDVQEHLKPRLEIEPLWVIEKRAIKSAIAQCDGNVNRAAGLLEVAPSTIYRKLQSWQKHERSATCTA